MAKSKNAVSSKKSCQTCGGAGQTGSFLGVSRFLLSWEECPECCGLGYIIAEDSSAEEDSDGGSSTKGLTQK